jgi:hypothetical protein
MRLATNSDPKQSGSSEWIRVSERIRERLAEESLSQVATIDCLLYKASRNRWVVPTQRNNHGKAAFHPLLQRGSKGVASVRHLI